MHMIQLLIDRCIIFVSLELLLFKYNSNKYKDTPKKLWYLLKYNEANYTTQYTLLSKKYVALVIAK